jgi:hypothetical protein
MEAMNTSDAEATLAPEMFYDNIIIRYESVSKSFRTESITK